MSPNLDDPMVRKLIHLVDLWWAEAGRYNVLPLDDRLHERVFGRGDLYERRTRETFYPGTIRILAKSAPETRNRSWAMSAFVDIPETGAAGPICVIGGSTNGWSLYVKDNLPVYCYNLIGNEYTYIRSSQPSRN
jgi:arylsulfatase